MLLTLISFFYPIVDICLVHMKDFSHVPTTDTRIVSLNGKLLDFIRIGYLFRVNRVANTTYLAAASLCSGIIEANFYLLLYSSTFWAFFILIYSCFSNTMTSYFLIIYSISYSADKVNHMILLCYLFLQFFLNLYDIIPALPSPKQVY